MRHRESIASVEKALGSRKVRLPPVDRKIPVELLVKFNTGVNGEVDFGDRFRAGRFMLDVYGAYGRRGVIRGQNRLRPIMLSL